MQHFINMQVRVTKKKEFYVEVIFTDMESQKKRIMFHSGRQYAYTEDNI